MAASSRSRSHSRAAAGVNTLALTGGTLGSETYNYATGTSGDIQVDPDGAGPERPTPITYTAVSAITATSTTTDRVFNLPGTDDAVILGDDGTSGNSLSRLWSVTGTFAPTTFANPAAGGRRDRQRRRRGRYAGRRRAA